MPLEDHIGELQPTTARFCLHMHEFGVLSLNGA